MERCWIRLRSGVEEDKTVDERIVQEWKQDEKQKKEWYKIRTATKNNRIWCIKLNQN